MQFKIFRALGISFKAWFANFLPITLIAAVLYSPAIVMTLMLPTGEMTQVDGTAAVMHIMWVVAAASALVAPFLTYRVIQYLNKAPSSIGDSIKFGARGILPVLILAGVVAALSTIGMIGALVSTGFVCVWWVCGPAAVVERLNVFAAFGRSAELTHGRRGGIFGLCIVMEIGVLVLSAFVGGFLAGLGFEFSSMLAMLVPVICVYRMFAGVVQAVSYSLLRADKDGISVTDLAKVFE